MTRDRRCHAVIAARVTSEVSGVSCSWTPVLVSSLMQSSRFPATLPARSMCVYVSIGRLTAFPAVLAFCWGTILNTARLPLIFTDGTSVRPLGLHKFAFGAAAAPLVLAEPLVPRSQTRPDGRRALPRVNLAAPSAGGNQVKRNASLDRVSRPRRGCFRCLGQEPPRSHSECELES